MVARDDCGLKKRSPKHPDASHKPSHHLKNGHVKAVHTDRGPHAPTTKIGAGKRKV